MRAAFVTGGSSGIGLCAALQLAAKGHDLALFGRDPAKLETARRTIVEATPTARVEIFPVDVGDHAAFVTALNDAVQTLGAPEMAIASAGLAQPGLFTDQSYTTHAHHMQVNYFGSLTFVQTLAPAMAATGGGKVGLIATGAAFFGIYGYGAYAPSKFALRALAEILHLELEPLNIGVTLIYPPDTDTPQLVEEHRTKPAATKAITAGGGLYQPDTIATLLIRGMERGKPVVTPGLQMTLLNGLTSLLAPLLRAHQRRLIRKHGHK